MRSIVTCPVVLILLAVVYVHSDALRVRQAQGYRPVVRPRLRSNLSPGQFDPETLQTAPTEWGPSRTEWIPRKRFLRRLRPQEGRFFFNWLWGPSDDDDRYESESHRPQAIPVPVPVDPYPVPIPRPPLEYCTQFEDPLTGQPVQTCVPIPEIDNIFDN